MLKDKLALSQLTGKDGEIIRAFLEGYERGKADAQPEPMKIDLSRCSKEDWERFKKEWANTPITAIAAQPYTIIDGRLFITVDDIEQVDCVVVEEHKSKFCREFWMADADEPAQPEPHWIPVTERLPKNNDPVNVTWINHNPEVYYMDIKGKPFTATAHYHNGHWYWYSSVTQDYLNEYDVWTPDLIDKDVEITAWMPLPEPYKGVTE